MSKLEERKPLRSALEERKPLRSALEERKPLRSALEERQQLISRALHGCNSCSGAYYPQLQPLVQALNTALVSPVGIDRMTASILGQALVPYAYQMDANQIQAINQGLQLRYTSRAIPKPKKRQIGSNHDMLCGMLTPNSVIIDQSERIATSTNTEPIIALMYYTLTWYLLSCFNDEQTYGRILRLAGMAEVVADRAKRQYGLLDDEVSQLAQNSVLFWSSIDPNELQAAALGPRAPVRYQYDPDNHVVRVYDSSWQLVTTLSLGNTLIGNRPNPYTQAGDLFVVYDPSLFTQVDGIQLVGKLDANTMQMLYPTSQESIVETPITSITIHYNWRDGTSSVFFGNDTWLAPPCPPNHSCYTITPATSDLRQVPMQGLRTACMLMTPREKAKFRNACRWAGMF